MFKKKTITANTSIELHPCAKNAYRWIKDYPRLVDHTKLSAEFNSELSKAHLFAVERKDERSSQTALQIYAPLSAILFWVNDSPPAGTQVFIDNSLTDKDIERQAWLSALLPFIHSIDTDKLYCVRDGLSLLMPLHLHQFFFSKNKVSDSTVCDLTNASRPTLVRHRQKANVKPKQACSTKSDLINLLATPWNESNKGGDDG